MPYKPGLLHQCIAPEEWLDVKGNLIPQMAFNYSPPYSKGTLMEQVGSIASLFDGLSYCQVQVFPEFSSLGRLHYHGYIYIFDVKEIIDFYRFDLPLLMKGGGICIKTITDPVEWSKYVFKQRVLTEKYFSEQGLRYELQYDDKAEEYIHLLLHKAKYKPKPPIVEESAKKSFNEMFYDPDEVLIDSAGGLQLC